MVAALQIVSKACDVFGIEMVPNLCIPVSSDSIDCEFSEHRKNPSYGSRLRSCVFAFSVAHAPLETSRGKSPFCSVDLLQTCLGEDGRLYYFSYFDSNPNYFFLKGVRTSDHSNDLSIAVASASNRPTHSQVSNTDAPTVCP